MYQRTLYLETRSTLLSFDTIHKLGFFAAIHAIQLFLKKVCFVSIMDGHISLFVFLPSSIRVQKDSQPIQFNPFLSSV